MPLYFITGNAGKLREVQAVMPDVEQLDIDLDEVQSLDPQRVIAHKLDEAARRHDGEFIVEDTSLAIDCLGGLPGPFIKWFGQALEWKGLGELVQRYNNHTAVARTTIGYRDAAGHVQFFVDELAGRIVMPQGDQGFGWDPIFVPEGHTQTFAELGPAIKNELSMRRRATEQLKEAIQKQ